MTKAYRTSGSFDLFPAHFMLPTFTPTQHDNEVYDELIESIQAMKKPAKSKLLRRLEKALRQISTGTMKCPAEGENTSSEGGRIQRVDPPIITTTTSPTEPNHLRQQPRSHQRVTRANQPGAVPAILTIIPKKRRSKQLNPIDAEEPILQPLTPNCSRIPFASSNIISQEAINLLTDRVYNDNKTTWIPSTFITSSPTTNDNRKGNYDADIEHFCAPVVHLITGETISNYKKLAKDPVMNETWATALGKEFGNITQGDNNTDEESTNCVFVMTP